MIPVVIGNYNRPDLTRKCIQSLNDHTKEDLRIVQVDNGCDDPEQFSPYYLDYGNKALGFTRAYNEGIRYARRSFKNWKYILLINNDVKVKKGWLPPLLAAIESQSRVAMVAPLWRDPINKNIGFPAHSDLIGGHIFGHKQIQEKGIEQTLTLNFSVVLISKEFIDDYGLMDESMVTFCSDVDYSLRASQAGWKCLVSKDVIIWHELNQTVKDLANKKEIKSKDQIALLNKWSGIYLNEVLKTIPLDNKRNAYARVTFLIMDEDGTVINWGTGEKTKKEGSQIQTKGVREQYEQIKRMGFEQ